MRQLITYAEGGHIQLAWMDDDSGELTQMGRFVWPEGYGLTEAAVLGSNLSQFLQLNGHKPRKKAATTPVVAALPTAVEPEPVKPKRGRPLGSQGKPTPGRRYISMDEVVAVINANPGIRCSEIASAIMGGGTVAWATKAVSNRLQAQRDKPNPPFHAEKHLDGKRGPYYLYWPVKA